MKAERLDLRQAVNAISDVIQNRDTGHLRRVCTRWIKRDEFV